jgi:hypothetical protein
MKRYAAVIALVGAGCAAAVPAPGPVESPNPPLVVLENSGKSATNVDNHYDDVNRITEELFDQP